MPFSPHRHFERKREIFFVCGQERLRGKRGTGNMLHATWGVRCFMQTALRRKTETGNEKDPSAALGMTKRERHISHSFSLRYGSQPPALRATSFQRKKNAVFPALSFRAKARNLFRLRSGETAREAGNGKHASCDLGSTVFHADGFTKENGNGERKRSLGCARDDETGWHISHCFSIPQRKPTSAPSGHLLPKEGGRMPFSPHRHFERKREIFFVCDGSGKVRRADNGKHRTPSE